MFVLEDLWDGNIQPCECRNSLHPNYKKAMNCLVESEEKLLEMLTGEAGRERLMDLENNQMEVSHWAEMAAFVEGFRLGGKITLDMLGIGTVKQ